MGIRVELRSTKKIFDEQNVTLRVPNGSILGANSVQFKCPNGPFEKQ